MSGEKEKRKTDWSALLTLGIFIVIIAIVLFYAMRWLMFGYF